MSDLYIIVSRPDRFGAPGWAVVMRVIKRLKSIWWMPWRAEAMKDVARCDKPRGAVSKL